jgi:hypothetical protein
MAAAAVAADRTKFLRERWHDMTGKPLKWLRRCKLEAPAELRTSSKSRPNARETDKIN